MIKSLTKFKKSPIGFGDHVYKAEEFIERCREGDFIDYDGYGEWCDGKEIFEDAFVYPSDVKKKTFKVLSGFIVWYNR